MLVIKKPLNISLYLNSKEPILLHSELQEKMDGNLIMCGL